MNHGTEGHGRGTRTSVGTHDIVKGFHGPLGLGPATGTSMTLIDLNLDNLIAKYITVQGGGPSTLIVNGNTTLNGTTTFNTGPVQFNTVVHGQTPTTNDEFVTKLYVDTLFGSGFLFLDSVRGFYDVSAGDPPGVWNNGDRVIQTVTAGGYVFNNIYHRVGGAWVLIPEGNSQSGWSVGTTDAPWIGMQWIYNAGTNLWSLFVLDHNVLLNRGTITHAQIDDHITNPISPFAHAWLGQDVSTTASPSFVTVTITGDATHRFVELQNARTLVGAGATTTIMAWTPILAALADGVWQVDMRAEGVTVAMAGTATIKRLYLVTVAAGLITAVTNIDSTKYLTGNLSPLGEVVFTAGSVGTNTLSFEATNPSGVNSYWACKVSAVGVQLP